MSKCEQCDGKGYIECPLEYGDDRHPASCPACGGRNKCVCPYCEGTGKD